MVVASLSLVAGATAQINVASTANGGVGTQSSLWTAGATADRAMDGNRDGRWSMGSVNHTNAQLNAWINIEFAQDELIDSVFVWNRLDGLQGRLNPFSVILRDAGNNIVWQSNNNIFVDNIVDGDANTEGMRFDVTPVVARSVMVQLDQSNYLHLAELEAYNAVPEPATLALAGLGLAAVVRRRARK